MSIQRPFHLISLDKDECQVNNGGCDVFNGDCINVPGSYLCDCKKGYQLKENSEFICEGESKKQTILLNERKFLIFLFKY